jgi:hypothetical protein
MDFLKVKGSFEYRREGDTEEFVTINWRRSNDAYTRAKAVGRRSF